MQPPIDEQSRKTLEIMNRFNDCFQRHDPSALADLVANDCVIENTVPAPDGARYAGREACIELWSEIATAPGTRFDLEDVWTQGDRATILWRFWFGEAQSVRGVNLMRVSDGRIVEAKGYVKGQ
jgi:ketosteroid isomerase-like protein